LGRKLLSLPIIWLSLDRNVNLRNLAVFKVKADAKGQ